MAAGQWFAESLTWAGRIPARVQGIYSPVAEAPGAPVRRGRAMGTPEIYFAKSIDNSRLVRVADPKRVQEMRMFVASLAVLFLLVMTYTWQHFSAIEYGYKIEAQKKVCDDLTEANRALKLDEARLRDPERIDVLARRMGMVAPAAGQVQRFEGSNDGALQPVFAQVRTPDVAVVVSQ
jgi:hypothetical protein